MGWIRTGDNIILRSDLLEGIEFEKKQDLAKASPRIAQGSTLSRTITVVGLFRKYPTVLERHQLAEGYGTFENAERDLSIMFERLHERPTAIIGLR